jgi:hypothetical protein
LEIYERIYGERERESERGMQTVLLGVTMMAISKSIFPKNLPKIKNPNAHCLL